MPYFQQSIQQERRVFGIRLLLLASNIGHKLELDTSHFYPSKIQIGGKGNSFCSIRLLEKLQHAQCRIVLKVDETISNKQSGKGKTHSIFYLGCYITGLHRSYSQTLHNDCVHDTHSSSFLNGANIPICVECSNHSSPHNRLFLVGRVYYLGSKVNVTIGTCSFNDQRTNYCQDLVCLPRCSHHQKTQRLLRQGNDGLPKEEAPSPVKINQC